MQEYALTEPLKPNKTARELLMQFIEYSNKLEPKRLHIPKSRANIYLKNNNIQIKPTRVTEKVSDEQIEAIEFAEWLRTFSVLTKENGYWVLEMQISSKKLYEAYLENRVEWRKNDA